MSVVELQGDHAARLAKLITFANDLGYIVTLGDCFRDDPGDSAHRQRLATDLNLFKYDQGKSNWVYLQETKDHNLLGMFWKSIGGIWGGDFEKSDGNHYESPADE